MNITLEGRLFILADDTLQDTIQESNWTIDNNTNGMDKLLNGGHHIDDHTMAHRRWWDFDRDKPCHHILKDCAKKDNQADTSFLETLK